MSLLLLNVLLILFGLPALVAPLAVHALRELTPASRPRPAFALGGGWR
jgi:hypothetical protein